MNLEIEIEPTYSVYMLLNEKREVFYVGFTKNFNIRMYEHKLLQGKNKKKDNIIRRMGRLIVKVTHGLTLENAQRMEKDLIARYKSQLTNIHSGGNYVPYQPGAKSPRKRTKRRRTCPICKQKFLQISRHKCKGER